MEFKELKPQIVTEIKYELGTVSVSSIKYKHGDRVFNETCIIFPDESSRVVGSYEDHCKIVEDLLK